MPAGLPSHLGRIKSLFPRLPDPVVRAIVGTYLRYSWTYTKLVTWYHYGRKYDAPIRPFELYHISPERIQYQPINKKGTTWECSVKAGDWDTNVTAFDDENLVHRSFIQRFVENKDWESTDLYSHAKEKIESDGAWEGRNSADGIIEELRLYDDMYDEIKNSGYKTQTQLRGSPSRDELQDKRYHPPEFAEISVDVGRDGRLIWYGGQHRISMAKILGLDSVPVRIRVRHEKWQRYRDEVWNDPSMDASWHPDLQHPD